ncbi:MAG: stalk domain-containing protein [Candidatus Pristimantibacillus sp.]
MYSKLRKKGFIILCSFIIALLFLIADMSISGSNLSHTLANTKNPLDDDVYRIVALGDSLTAGYEQGFTEQSIPYGYVEHIYEQALFHGLHAEYKNYGILGLKTTGFNLLTQAIVSGNTVIPDNIQKDLIDPRAEQIVGQTKQMTTSVQSADLIVMTIGGNDLMTILSKLEADLPDEDLNTLLQDILNNYEQQLELALRNLLKLQPNAQIVIANQYLPVPAPLKLGAITIPLYPEADRQFLIGSLTQLHNRLTSIASRLNGEGYHLNTVNVNGMFRNNELKFTTLSDGDVHPNRQGYAAMGNRFARTIWGEYRTVRPRPANVPISVVVAGKELPASASPPVLRNNRTFVAMRDISDAIGAKLQWDAASKTAVVTYNGHRAAFTIAASEVSIDGAKVKLNSPPAYLHKTGKESKTYLPLAALSEALGLQVVYRDTLQTVFINK